MKNFTGKVTNVDNNGNPIKKKSCLLYTSDAADEL